MTEITLPISEDSKLYLDTAVESDDLSGVVQILKEDPDVDLNMPGSNRNPLTAVAVERQNMEILRILATDPRTDIFAKNCQALWTACSTSNREMIWYILNVMHSRDNGRTAQEVHTTIKALKQQDRSNAAELLWQLYGSV